MECLRPGETITMGAFGAIVRAVDEGVGLKRVYRSLGFIAKVLIVTTFVEDALRVVLTFSEQQQSMQTAGWQTPVLHTALPVLSLCVQLGGSLLIVLPASAVAGCYVLLGWCLFHPFMYKQQTNWEFMLETTTIIGGLLVLLSHEQLNAHASAASILLPGGAKPSEALKERGNRLKMLGRVLITAIFFYYAYIKVHGYARRAADVEGTPVVEALLISGLVCMSSLVIVGMKSRWCALLLAVMMACSAFYMHPFWKYYFGKSAVETYLMQDVPGMEGTVVEAFTMADHQRYFFFQRMSTVGALLLLIVHGPGNFSLDEQQGTTETMLKSVERKSYS